MTSGKALELANEIDRVFRGNAKVTIAEAAGAAGAAGVENCMILRRLGWLPDHAVVETLASSMEPTAATQ